MSQLRQQDWGYDHDDWKFKLIELCETKMRNEEKRLWGLKATIHLTPIVRHGRKRAINIIRDGQDVLASQQNTGSFAGSPEALAKS